MPNHNDLRVYFFKPGKDCLSRLVRFAGWLTGRNPTYTHVAVRHHDLDTLFHLRLGSGEWVPLHELLEWSPECVVVWVPVSEEMDDTSLIFTLSAMQYSGVSFIGLLQLLFRKRRPYHNHLVCTDLPQIARGMLPYNVAATPDELYTLYTTLYRSQDGEK